MNELMLHVTILNRFPCNFWVVKPNGKLLLALVFVVAWLLSSCRPLYVPNRINVPMLTKKNDFNGTLGVGLDNTIEAQAAWSPFEKAGLMTNLQLRTPTNPKSKESGFFGELGAGSYWQIASQSMIDFYGGFGMGTSSYRYREGMFSSSFKDEDLVHIQGDYQRIFLQPSINFLSKHIDGALTLRQGWIMMQKTEKETIDNRTAAYVSHYKTAYTEPVATVKYRWKKYLQIVAQGGISIPHSLTPGYTWQPLIINIALSIDLGRYKNKSQTDRNYQN